MCKLTSHCMQDGISHDTDIVHLKLCLSVCQSVCVCLCLSLCLSVGLSVCVCVCACLCVCLFVCLSVSLSLPLMLVHYGSNINPTYRSTTDDIVIITSHHTICDGNRHKINVLFLKLWCRKYCSRFRPG